MVFLERVSQSRNSFLLTFSPNGCEGFEETGNQCLYCLHHLLSAVKDYFMLYLPRGLCPVQNLLSILQQWHVDHLAVQGEGAFAFLLAGSERGDNPLRVFNR